MDRTSTAEHDRMAFGEFLRQARERRRLTLEQIAGETKIAPRLLTSLEQGNVQPMPKGMYRRAMLRAYAESVGLDTEAALTEFERTFEEPPPREVPLPTLPDPVATPHASVTSPSPRSVLRLAIVGIALAVVAGIGLWALSGDAEPVASTATVGAPPEARPASTPAGPPQPAATATAGTSDAAAVAPVVTPPPPERLATEGQLVIVSEPPGARVTVNGVGWGSTPLTIRYLPLGGKRVRLTMDGYISQERTVSLEGRRPNATVRLTLKPRP